MAESDRQAKSSDADSAHAAIGRLYREHNESLIRFLKARVGSEQEARDIAQEAYVRMLRLDSRGASSFLSAYLFRIASNIVIDRGRQRTVRSRIDRDLAPEPLHSSSAEHQAQAQETLRLIERFVEELPPKCRQAFYLHRLHELSPSEIAAQIGVKKRTVHHYLMVALVHLRLRLDVAEGSTETDAKEGGS
jgi:RNA polymerase sigma factor (sigma-70 family)